MGRAGEGGEVRVTGSEGQVSWQREARLRAGSCQHPRHLGTEPQALPGRETRDVEASFLLSRKPEY